MPTCCFRAMWRQCVGGLFALFFLMGANAEAGENIGTAWDNLLQNTTAQNAPDPALTAPQTPYEAGPASDFQDHFFVNTRTEYLRTQTYFSGLPTLTGVVNGTPGTIFTPGGIPYSPAFQSSTNVMYNFMNWGTRGWISDRVSSNFSFAYGQDLSHVTDASPQLDILNTTGSNRRLQLLSGYIDIEGRPTDGVLAGTSLVVGRQYVYGAELAQMDGASFSVNRRRFSWTIYAGRRFTNYSDPQQRAIGGGNFLFRFSDNATFEYDTLYYIKGTNLFRYRQTIGGSWLLGASFRMVGSSPTDFTADVMWTPSNGKTSLRVGFAGKLSNNDYFYDYAYNVRDNDPYNTFTRLNLGALQPYTQYTVDGSRAINSKLRLGGALWLRWLVKPINVGPFDTSFSDYRANAQIFPGGRYDLFAGYHIRFSGLRTNDFTPPTQFDDLSTTGETQVQDVSVEIGRTMMKGRLHFKAGGFYRQLNFRDLFTVISDAHDKGVLGDATFKMDSKTQLFMNYGLDTDYPVFRPSIQNSQTFRFGLAWSY
ncbi:MAG TPA: hypothetical protein VJX69_11435 [Terriglobales bacterium]|nr:hypothetical protein [Terriglobales bacterium]